MKQISHKRAAKTIGIRLGAVIMAVTLALPVIAQDSPPGEGSLEDIWQDHLNNESKPKDSKAEPEKPSKSKSKSKKSKGKKSEPEASPEKDLTKSPEPASGWESSSSPSTPASSSPSSPSSSFNGDIIEQKPASTGTTSVKSSTPAQEASAPAAKTTAPSVPSTSKSTTPAVTTPAPVDTNSTGSTSAATQDDDNKSDTTATSSSDDVQKPSGEMQPLCKFTSLTTSEFVKSGGWPGVGPFSQDKANNSLLVDESKNELKLKLSGEDVTHAELLLVNQSPKPSQLLALQMTADFLLEAVGAQAGKIADFNSALQENQQKLASAEQDGPVNLKAGTYTVQIQRKKAQNATVPGNISYLIALDNQKPAVVASAVSKVDNTSFSIFAPNNNTSTSTTTSTTPAAVTTPVKPPPTKPADDLLHRQFTNLIQSWQQVKRAAVKTRQSGSLTRILGGKALATQNRAIEWLLNSRRYYEMTPIELKVQTYTEVTPGAKYEVETFIKERQQMMNADTMKPVKDNVMAYNVVYTVEKIRGAWLITDTRVVTPQ